MLSRLRRRYGDAFSIELPLFGPSVDRLQPHLRQAPVPGEAGRGRLRRAQPARQGARPGLAVLARRRRASRGAAPDPARLPRRADEELRGDHRGGGAARDGVAGRRAREFSTLEPFMRITLNSILRAVFGAEGKDVAALAKVLPDFVTLGSRLSLIPPLQRDLGRLSPGGRLKPAARPLRRDHRPDDRRPPRRPPARGARRRDVTAAARATTTTAPRCRARRSPTSC